MDVREKLVELILSTDLSLSYSRESDALNIADVLIAHGVTVQKRGRWKIIMDDYDCEMMCCSVCGSEFYDGDNDTVDCLHNYCPHCGSKMMPQLPKGE